MNASTAELRRDAEVIGLVGFAHLLSHFFQLILAPLFALLTDKIDDHASTALNRQRQAQIRTA